MFRVRFHKVLPKPLKFITIVFVITVLCNTSNVVLAQSSKIVEMPAVTESSFILEKFDHLLSFFPELFNQIKLLAAAILGGEPGYPPFKSETYSIGLDQKIIPNFADVDILKISNYEFYITGTANNPQFIKIYKTTDLNKFELYTVYNPSLVPTAPAYCQIWAPDLSFIDGQYVLTFSAAIKSANGDCPSPVTPTLYQVKADDLKHFGRPQTIRFGEVASGYGRNKYSMRIDPDYFRGRMYYTWFSDAPYGSGNHISSVLMQEPYGIIDNTNPGMNDEYNTEGAQVFERDGNFYLQFSNRGWRHAYSTWYIRASSQLGLIRREDNVFPLAQAIIKPNCSDINSESCVLENYGHGAIFSRDGQYYYLHHRGNPASGSVTRSAYLTPIYFSDDGKIIHMTKTNLVWNNLGTNYRYSLDVLPKGGNWIGPCVNSGVILNNTSYEYTGVCSQNGQMVRKQEVDKFRICYTSNMLWSNGNSRCVTIDNDVTKDELHFELQPILTTVHLVWNNLGTNYRYSLDVLPKGGNWIGPCVNSGVILNNTSYEYTGVCVSNVSQNVPLPTIDKFRICYSKDNRWDSGYVKCVTNSSTMTNNTLQFVLTPISN